MNLTEIVDSFNFNFQAFHILNNNTATSPAITRAHQFYTQTQNDGLRLFLVKAERMKQQEWITDLISALLQECQQLDNDGEGSEQRQMVATFTELANNLDEFNKNEELKSQKHNNSDDDDDDDNNIVEIFDSTLRRNEGKKISNVLLERSKNFRPRMVTLAKCNQLYASYFEGEKSIFGMFSPKKESSNSFLSLFFHPAEIKDPVHDFLFGELKTAMLNFIKTPTAEDDNTYLSLSKVISDKKEALIQSKQEDSSLFILLSDFAKRLDILHEQILDLNIVEPPDDESVANDPPSCNSSTQ